MAFRIFVAFDVDRDQDVCDQLLESSRGQGVFEVSGRSQSGVMSEPWQRKTQSQIAAADQVIVFCGEHTDESERIATEVRMAREQEKPLILLWSRRDGMCKKPAGALPDDNMYSWTPDILREQLQANLRKAQPLQVPDRLKRQPSPARRTEG